MLKAATDAGIPEAEARSFIEDPKAGLRDTQNSIRETAGNGIDAVPHITIIGKRRDITIEGAKEIEEFEKELHRIARESK